MKIFSIILLSLLFSGCSLFGTKIEDARPDPVVTVNRTLLAYSCPPPPQLDKYTPRSVDWDVISRKELDAEMVTLMEELDVDEDILFIINQATGDFFFLPNEDVIWSLSADDYANLGRNTSDVLAAIRQMKDVVRHYKQCIADSETAVLEQNLKEAAENTSN